MIKKTIYFQIIFLILAISVESYSQNLNQIKVKQYNESVEGTSTDVRDHTEITGSLGFIVFYAPNMKKLGKIEADKLFYSYDKIVDRLIIVYRKSKFLKGNVTRGKVFIAGNHSTKLPGAYSLDKVSGLRKDPKGLVKYLGLEVKTTKN